MAKAKALEVEMLQVKQQKLQSLLNQFQIQLQRETMLEEQQMREVLDLEYSKQVNQLDAELQSRSSEIIKLQQSLDEQIEFFKNVRADLENKRKDLHQTFEASVSYLRKECA